MADKKNSIRQLKSTHWSVTIFGNANIMRFWNKVDIPVQIKELGGQLELAPTTGTEYYQGWISCNGQQRASIILDWLPGTHVEKAKSITALKRYCMKDETSAGMRETGYVNPEEYLTIDKALDKLARYCPEDKDCPKEYDTIKKIIEWQFWEGVKSIIEESPSQIGLYSQPQIYRAWQHTRSVWIERAKSIVLQPASEEVTNSGEENLYD